MAVIEGDKVKNDRDSKEPKVLLQMTFLNSSKIIKPWYYNQVQCNLCSVNFDPMNKLIVFPARDSVRMGKQMLSNK